MEDSALFVDSERDEATFFDEKEIITIPRFKNLERQILKRQPAGLLNEIIKIRAELETLRSTYEQNVGTILSCVALAKKEYDEQVSLANKYKNEIKRFKQAYQFTIEPEIVEKLNIPQAFLDLLYLADGIDKNKIDFLISNQISYYYYYYKNHNGWSKLYKKLLRRRLKSE